MKVGRKGLCIFLIGCMLFTGGCSRNEVTVAAQEKEDMIQIGMCFDSFVIERWQRDRDVFVSTAQSLGAKVYVQNANGDVNEQIAQIRYFIKQGVDVIAIIAIDNGKLSEVVKEARKAGIKVLAYDRQISNAGADLYISFDNEKVGELMAQGLAGQLPNGGSILMMCGSSTDKNVEAVQNGFEKVAKEKNLEIKDVMYASGWKPEEVYTYLSANYRYLNDVDAIMCGNDSLAGQAVKYLAERRMAGEILVSGQDADLDACQRIVEGTQLMTVYKPVEKLARVAAESAVALAKGEEIDTQEVISDGTYEIPYIALEPITVNQENLDQVIIDSGYHLKEDVYLNVK